MSADSAKILLERSNHQRYRAFSLNTDTKLTLPRPSSVPWIGATQRKDVFSKELSHEAPQHIKFIKKNNKPHAFLWQSNAEQLQQGVRWGILKTQSMSSKVISTLGQYRIKAHERAARGMVSQSQAVKLKLLDLYQDRFTALQDIESLVNKNNTHDEYTRVFSQYISDLETIDQQLDNYFSEVEQSGLNQQVIMEIKADIQADTLRARKYLQSLLKEDNLRPYNRARGEKSVLEFVKQQMIYGLYELQGINQDISYSKKRFFALTRGELNDYIEDARKEIDDHQADVRNGVTEKHHGKYSSHKDALITYDFSQDDLSVEREKQVLLAISFIEGWDRLENKKNASPVISNGSQSEALDTYAATRWKTHRNVISAIKSIGYFVVNSFKGIFVPTRSWEEEAWKNKDFHLNAVALRAHVKPTEPIWKKPMYFFMQIGYAFIDIYKGIRDFGSKLMIKMPEEIVNDWACSQSIPPLEQVIKEATRDIIAINKEEQERLLEILKRSGNEVLATVSKEDSTLARVEYELSAQEQNDILNAMVRGLQNFCGTFANNIYAKDPIGGLVFTTTYLAGIGMIYLPAYSASIFGSNVVNTFNNISYAMASTPLGAAIAGGSTLAEASAVAWDGVVHGPSGIAVNVCYQLGEDPLTIGAYGAAAYALGYFMVNGIAGHQIPVLSELLKEDLGTDPSTGYPIIGAKFAIMLYEALVRHPDASHEQPCLRPLHSDVNALRTKNNQVIERYTLALWMSTHAKTLPKLDSDQQFAIAQQLERVFSKEESASLKQLMYPEAHASIAFQIIAIPLAYIPALLRFSASFVIGFMAWVNGNPHPVEPIRRAGQFVLNTLKRDLSRLAVLASAMVYLAYSLITPLIKMVSAIAVMAIGRVSGLFEGTIGHASYKFFASLHNGMRTLGEFFYPARMIKHVSVAHPTDTILKTEGSYVNMLQQMVTGDAAAEPAPKDRTHFDCSLTVPGSSRKIGVEEGKTIKAESIGVYQAC